VKGNTQKLKFTYKFLRVLRELLEFRLLYQAKSVTEKGPWPFIVPPPAAVTFLGGTYCWSQGSKRGVETDTPVERLGWGWRKSGEWLWGRNRQFWDGRYSFLLSQLSADAPAKERPFSGSPRVSFIRFSHRKPNI
jgi:hypothetical protein